MLATVAQGTVERVADRPAGFSFRRGRPMGTKTCAGQAFDRSWSRLSPRCSSAPFRRAPARPATPSTASTARSSPRRREAGRDPERDRRPEDQPLRPAEEEAGPQLLEVGLRVARRGRVRRATCRTACAGKAVWKRKKNRWRVDKCENQMQPRRRCSIPPKPAPAFGYNDNWIFQSNTALDQANAGGAQIARTSLAWRGVEGQQGSYNWYGSDALYNKLLERGMRPLWVIIDAPCWAQPNPGACAVGRQPAAPGQAALRRVRPVRGDRGEALPEVGRDRDLERAQLPALLGRLARRRPVREDAQGRPPTPCTRPSPGCRW